MTDVERDVEDFLIVRSLSLTYRDGHRIEPHAHGWAQLVYGRSGIMRVVAADRIWFVPPTRAIWIPPGTRHQFVVRGDVAFRTLYIRDEPAGKLAKEPVGLEVTPLLTEIIQYICGFGMLDNRIPEHANLASVLFDLINRAPANDLSLPLPSDARARRFANRIQEHPADKSDLKALAALSGASLRTLQRCFTREAGLTIEAWRQKARLIASTAVLSAGGTVTDAAYDCGYDSPSAFIAAFKRAFDVTPGRFRQR